MCISISMDWLSLQWSPAVTIVILLTTTQFSGTVPMVNYCYNHPLVVIYTSDMNFYYETNGIIHFGPKAGLAPVYQPKEIQLFLKRYQSSLTVCLKCVLGIISSNLLFEIRVWWLKKNISMLFWIQRKTGNHYLNTMKQIQSVYIKTHKSLLQVLIHVIFNINSNLEIAEENLFNFKWQLAPLSPDIMPYTTVSIAVEITVNNNSTLSSLSKTLKID